MSSPTESPAPVQIIVEIKLPVPVKELAAITDAMTRIYGKSLRMRQSGTYLQIFKPA